MQLTAELLCEVSRVRTLAARGEARRLRVQRGISLREAAQVIGCSPGSLSRWETGLCPPRADAALRWAGLLDALNGEPS